MSGGQEKKFSTLGPKLSESKAQQNYGDKTLQTRVQVIDYSPLRLSLRFCQLTSPRPSFSPSPSQIQKGKEEFGLWAVTKIFEATYPTLKF